MQGTQPSEQLNTIHERRGISAVAFEEWQNLRRQQLWLTGSAGDDAVMIAMSPVAPGAGEKHIIIAIPGEKREVASLRFQKY